MLKHHKFTKISVQEIFLVVCVIVTCMYGVLHKLCMSMLYILVNFPLAWLC